MNWSALFAEPQPIAPHALIAIGAFGLGALQLALPKTKTTIGFMQFALEAPTLIIPLLSLF